MRTQRGGTFDKLSAAVLSTSKGGGGRGIGNSRRNSRKQVVVTGSPAAWSAVAPLSEKSVASRSGSVELPDFTRRARRSSNPLGIVDVDPARLPTQQMVKDGMRQLDVR